MRSFWPLWSVIIGVLALLMLGIQDRLSLEWVWGLGVIALIATLFSIWYAARHLRSVHPSEAMARIDRAMTGRPLQALRDEQVIGQGDAASEALWQAYRTRLLKQAQDAKPVAPDLRISERDPFALRYVAALGLAIALLFGSIRSVGTVSDIATRPNPAATGPGWEGWVEPPAYTGLPTLYLADQKEDQISLPNGSRIILRLYGEIGELVVSETISGRMEDVPGAADPGQEIQVKQDGHLQINGPDGRKFTVSVLADAVPEINLAELAETSPEGTMALPYSATDDYAIASGTLSVQLDLNAVDRRYGLETAPETRAEIAADLPLPISGDRSDFTEPFVEDFSKHPWAHLPVIFTARVMDDAGQVGQSNAVHMVLPGRRFFDPVAAAIIEGRRDLLWSRENAPRVARVLRAISHKPDGFFHSETAYLQLRVILSRLETQTQIGLSKANRDEITEALWELALKLEEGDVNSARERMQQAQKRLSQAMRNGASEQEIDRLMQELRDASRDYMRQLRREARESDNFAQSNENSIEVDNRDLQEMMDRIQELMEQGRMAEAEQALQEYMEMTENMQITQNPGQDGDSEGDQAMEGLADTLREQQGLSDEAFRDLQEQFNPGAQQGQSSQNEGRNGGEGRGQSHEGATGQGQGEEGDGQSAQSLSQRQQALRDELNRQGDALPLPGGEGQEEASRNLDRAGRAMDEAAEALEDGNLPEAIDRQAEAMDALREGMRSLSEAIAETRRQQQGLQGQAESGQQRQSDPLGRDLSGNGLDNRGGTVPGEEVYRRAQRLLDEIRRRSGDADRPDVERNYLERLLNRF